MLRSLTRRMFGATLAAGAALRPAFAGVLPTPQGRPILSVSGRIGVRNDGDAASFDWPMLEALGMQGFATATPWYPAVTRFDGVPMRTLLRTVEASGSSVIAIALNDYTTEIPIADFEQYNVLLALRRDGEYMPVRDKGPLFIVYPYDSDKALQSRMYYSRSAWQVSKIIVQ